LIGWLWPIAFHLSFPLPVESLSGQLLIEYQSASLPASASPFPFAELLRRLLLCMELFLVDLLTECLSVSLVSLPASAFPLLFVEPSSGRLSRMKLLLIDLLTEYMSASLPASVSLLPFVGPPSGQLPQMKLLLLIEHQFVPSFSIPELMVEGIRPRPHSMRQLQIY
jgi:hypothetical protein